MPCRLGWMVLVAAVLLPWPTLVSAQSPRPLPAADLVTLDGTAVTLRALAQDSQWVVLYVNELSTPSQRLLNAAGDWGLAAALVRVVVVVGPAGDVKAAATEFGERLPGARWVADPSGSVAREAGLRGAPTVIGARGGEIGWILAGVLNDPAMVRDVIKGWLLVP